jgi:hypothetical protein
MRARGPTCRRRRPISRRACAASSWRRAIAPHGVDHEKPPADRPDLVPYWDRTGCVLGLCNQSASEGCVIEPLNIRNMIGSSGDHVLQVVP